MWCAWQQGRAPLLIQLHSSPMTATIYKIHPTLRRIFILLAFSDRLSPAGLLSASHIKIRKQKPIIAQINTNKIVIILRALFLALTLLPKYSPIDVDICVYFYIEISIKFLRSFARIVRSKTIK